MGRWHGPSRRGSRIRRIAQGRRVDWHPGRTAGRAASADRPRRLRPAVGKVHQYAGQRFGGSSAFVFGRRVDGAWKFHAQVVKGNMSNPASIDLESDLTILKCPKTGAVLHEI